MKKLSLLTLIFFLNIFTFNSYAKIVYIDLNFIINKSEVGITLNNHIKKLKEKNLSKFNQIENELKQMEKSLLSQQNILEKQEFNKKLSNLSNEIKKYQSNKKKSMDSLKSLKMENTKKIINFLNPIITNYVDKNSISLVVPKKNIIVGKKNLDITDEIIKLLNDQNNTLNLKWKIFFLKKEMI